MTRAAKLTMQETVLLTQQILLLRAEIEQGKAKPVPGQWAKEIEQHIGRVVTYDQIRSTAESLGFGKRDLWATVHDEGGSTAEKCRQMVAHAELRLGQQVREVEQKSDGTEKRLGLVWKQVQARDASVNELRNTVGLLTDRIGALHERLGKLESEIVLQRSGVCDESN